MNKTDTNFAVFPDILYSAGHVSVVLSEGAHLQYQQISQLSSILPGKY
jgi:hypothetical protein